MTSILIGIAVNYPLHFLCHKQEGGDWRELVSPLLIGNITTVGAFLVLIPLKAAATRDLGIFAALMLVGTILFTLLILPHMVGNVEARRPYGANYEDKIYMKIKRQMVVTSLHDDSFWEAPFLS